MDDACTLNCCHRFCFECMSGFVAGKIREGDVGEAAMACPKQVKMGVGEGGRWVSCGEPLTPYEVQACVDEDAYQVRRSRLTSHLL